MMPSLPKLPKFKWSFSNGLVVFLIIINILPILAPIFMHWGWVLPAKAIYFIYSFTCHQIHWRSLHLHDHQCAWCARDMAIWGALLFTVLALKLFKLRGLKVYQIIPFMIPIALDGGIQTIATAVGMGGGGTVYVSTNFMRMVTGSIFGIGLGASVMPMITNLEFKDAKTYALIFKERFKVNQWAIFGGIFALMVALYLVFVQLWIASSQTYLPSDAWDSAVKLPAETTLLERRKNGICPVELGPETMNVSDTLGTDCFFGKDSL